MDFDKLSSVNTNLWISANAGSGKTTQLVNRFLLLLKNGVNVNDIVCITYTDAAAKEMKIRIIAEARKHGIEIQEWQLNISTIHSFCKKMLTLNGFIKEDIKILNDNKYEIESIVNKIITILDEQEDNNINKIIDTLVKTESLAQFHSFIAEILKNQNLFLSLFINICQNEQQSSIDNIIENVNLEQIYLLLPERLQQFVGYTEKLNIQKKALQNQLLKQDKNILWKEANDIAGTKQNTIQYSCEELLILENWRYIVLSTTNSVRKKLSKCNNLLIHEIKQYFVEKLRQYGVDATYHILHLAYVVLKIYKHIKIEMDVLTYDDLLFQTNQALRLKVLFKDNVANNGKNIKHLMLDEAQDTNPISWEIIENIILQTKCKFFVVGDKKQSIYRFQGARVEEYEKNENIFRQISVKNGIEFVNNVVLNTSYRSTQEVLDYVDEFCLLNIDAFTSNQHEMIKHYSGLLRNSKPYGYFLDKNNTIFIEKIDFKTNIKMDNDNLDKNAWINRTMSLELKQQEEQKNIENIADRLAKYILLYQKDLNDGVISKTDRLAIIYPTRGAKGNLIFDIVSVLQEKYNFTFNLTPDIIKTTIYYHDIIAILQFYILQNDNANLACLLKSDLFKVTDEVLLHFANYRASQCGDITLWEALKSCVAVDELLKQNIQHIVNILKTIISCNSLLEVFEYISVIINNDAKYESAFLLINNFFAKNVDLYNYDVRGFLYALETANSKDLFCELFKDGIYLSTIHGVKGMEFDTVILMKLNEKNNSTNHKKKYLFFKNYFWYKTGLCVIQKDDVFCQDLLNNIDIQNKQEDFESKRLEYVALTRAKRRICIFQE